MGERIKETPAILGRKRNNPGGLDVTPRGDRRHFPQHINLSMRWPAVTIH
jgi:hypothetical protein